MSDASTHRGELWTFHIPVDFEVAARTRREARDMIDTALTGDSAGSLAPFQEQVHVRTDGDVVGVLGWSHHDESFPAKELPHSQQRSFLADLSTIEVLRALFDGDAAKARSERILTDAELEQIELTLVAADRFVVIRNPDDASFDPLFQGHASEAIDTLPDGVYDAEDLVGEPIRLVVGPSRFVAEGRAGATLPVATVDSRRMDEISRLLDSGLRPTRGPSTLERISHIVTATGRDGLDSAEILARRVAANRPQRVTVGVVVWSDDVEAEPTIVADTNSVDLTRRVAALVHEQLEDGDGYQGAGEFLATHSAPSGWEGPRDVDRWLLDLADATPYPRVTVTELRLTGELQSHADVFADALAHRSQQLHPDDMTPATGDAARRTGLER